MRDAPPGRLAHELSGAWIQPDACFLWEEVQLFHRRSSDHPHDYWVVHAWGACLASSCRYTTGRFDPRTRTLDFPPCARALLNGPWHLLAAAAPSSARAPLLVKQRLLERATARLPGLASDRSRRRVSVSRRRGRSLQQHTVRRT